MIWFKNLDCVPTRKDVHIKLKWRSSSFDNTIIFKNKNILYINEKGFFIDLDCQNNSLCYYAYFEDKDVDNSYNWRYIEDDELIAFL